jgi:MtN3 and saliva related transmembrane protein
MNWVEAVGALAGILTTIAFIPQVVKTWRSRSAEDISLFMFLLFSTGVALWLVYGIAIASVPVIAANAITLILALSILVLKVRYMWLQRRRLKQIDQRTL